MEAAALDFRFALYSTACSRPDAELGAVALSSSAPSFDMNTWSLLYTAVAVKNREQMNISSMAFTVLLVGDALGAVATP